jgi:hypothetical protein
MKFALAMFLALPLMAHAYSVSDLKLALNDPAVLGALGSQSIRQINEAPCIRMRGAFCLEITLANGTTVDISGNSFFGTVDVNEN